MVNLNICTDTFDQTVIFNPKAKHWYLDTRTSFVRDSYPTKDGKLELGSLTKTMSATQFFGINIEHFTSYDVLFLKNEFGKIGVFTMVDGSGQEFGNFYRTDHKGFGYRNAHLFIDKRGYHRIEGSQHYLTTEDLYGKWALICLYHPLTFINGGYNEFISRYCLAKDMHSETEVINYFKNELAVADLLDSKTFTYIDPSTPDIHD